MHIPSEVAVTITGEDSTAVHNVAEHLHDVLVAVRIQVRPADPLYRARPPAQSEDFIVTLNANPAYGGRRKAGLEDHEQHCITVLTGGADEPQGNIEVRLMGRYVGELKHVSELLMDALEEASIPAIVHHSIVAGENPLAAAFAQTLSDNLAREDSAAMPNAFDPLKHQVVNKEPNNLVLTSIQSAFPDCDEAKARWLWDKLLMWGDAYSPGPKPGEEPTTGLAGAR